MSRISYEIAKKKILKGLEECSSISELAEKTGYSRKTI